MNIYNKNAYVAEKGGLITYIHKSFSNPPKVDNIYKKSTDWEPLIVDVQDDRFARKITIVNYYRPPRDNYSNASIDKFLTPLEVILKKLEKQNSVIILSGDSNINLLRISKWSKCQEYFDLLTTHSLFPCITMPTRFTQHSATLIDDIFCREKQDMIIVKSGIITAKISDHLPCFTIIKIKKANENPPNSSPYALIMKRQKTTSNLI